MADLKNGRPKAGSTCPGLAKLSSRGPSRKILDRVDTNIDTTKSPHQSRLTNLGRTTRGRCDNCGRGKRVAAAEKRQALLLHQRVKKPENPLVMVANHLPGSSQSSRHPTKSENRERLLRKGRQRMLALAGKIENDNAIIGLQCRKTFCLWREYGYKSLHEASEYSHLAPLPGISLISLPSSRSTPTLRKAFTHHSGYPESPKYSAKNARR